MKKLLLAAGLLGAVLNMNAQDCTAVAELNENFDNYTTGQTEVISQYCWTAISNGMYIYPATVSGSPAAQFYTFTTPGQAAYLVSPEVNSFDGNHTLTFDASSSTAVALQPGYLTNPADATTFVTVGSEITLAAAPATTYTITDFPALEANAYIAFRFVAAGNHNTASVDNIVWAENPDACPAVSSINETFDNYTTGQAEVISQYCWTAISNGMYIYPATVAGSPAAQFYTFTTPGQAAFLVSPEVNSFDGNHTLTFDASSSTAVVLQPGYLTDAADAATFVAVGSEITLAAAPATTYTITDFPALETNAYIAFRFVAAGAHNTASVDNIVWAETPDACPAVSSINENFDNYATGQQEVITQYCWTAISNGMYVYPATVAGSPAAQFYSFMTPGVAGYLVSPEVNSFDGNHTLTFDASSSTAVVLQPGYLTDAADDATFVAVGSEITLAAAPATTYTITDFPALETNAYIAFRFVAANAHNTASVDNIVWETTAGVDNLQKKAFTLYPNPAVNGMVNIANTSGNEGTVNVYSLTGANVFQAKAATGNQQLNLSQLGAGMYIVQFTTGNYTTSQKLIIQ